MCFLFAALVEFALVNSLARKENAPVAKDSEDKDTKNSADTDINQNENPPKLPEHNAVFGHEVGFTYIYSIFWYTFMCYSALQY